MSKILLATDLDRTLLPNGEWEESPRARELFAKVAAREEVVTMYISGRSLDLLREAVDEYSIPVADYMVGYVGTVIYRPSANGEWEELKAWHEEVAPDWGGMAWDDVKALFDEIQGIRVQEKILQSPFKLSYYTDEDVDHKTLRDEMQAMADAAGIKTEILWSVDPHKKVGLLDVLAKSATKVHAMEFVRENILKLPRERGVFCGDSGNDIPALVSGLNAVMVRNTPREVQEEVAEIAKEKGIEDKIYSAKGDFLGMNGYYGAGVLEGLAHFFPETRAWFDVS